MSAWWTHLIGEKIYPGWIPLFMTSLVPSKILSPFDDPCNAILLVSTMAVCGITSSLSTNAHYQICGKHSQENPTVTESKHGKCNVC